jgi:hypothetical protein
VAEKRSVAEDIYRFDAHIYPLVGAVPLRQFTIEHAESVMRALPEDRSPATRRHVAQLMSRVLKLAVYPGPSSSSLLSRVGSYQSPARRKPWPGSIQRKSSPSSRTAPCRFCTGCSTASCPGRAAQWGGGIPHLE